MDPKLLCPIAFALFLLAHIVDARFDFITKYGVKFDADISTALLSSWKKGCNSTTPTTIVIPKGTFPMKQVVLSGPCKAPIELQIHATLIAPLDPKTLNPNIEWLTIQRVDNFTLSGGGILDGQGALAWSQNDCRVTTVCNKLPNNLSFNFLTNSVVRDITSLNSKLFHVNVFGGKNLTFDNVTIITPGTSPNTDGIHIAKIVNVNVINSRIATGDDCISIGDGTENLHVTNVKCGPGHGISVGSLGRTPGETPVKGIFVKNCTLVNTDNGIRVKTWPSSFPGVVTDLHFEDIIMENVKNPILIDQEYCPNNQCQLGKPSLVKISKVSYKNIRGTSATEYAVIFTCSVGVPCEGIEVADINLTFNGTTTAKSKCSNVNPTAHVSPSPSPSISPSLAAAEATAFRYFPF